jgi:hypothetical protein
MSFASRFLIPTCAAAGVLTFAVAQKPPEQLSARDMFYHPVQESPSSGGARKTPNTTKSGSKGAVQVATATRDKAPDRPQSTSTQTQVPNPATPTPSDGGRVTPATVRKTAAAPADNPALGLRYTLMKKDAEVATDTVFHTGDQVQLRIETNQSAYLYIISQGSSGTWKVQVPSADAADNHVEEMRPYYFPSKDQAFGFHDPKGAEKLFLIVSHEPIPDIQDAIYGLQGKGQQGKPTKAAEPEPPQRQAAIIEARLNIPNDKISQMRSLYSRDLIIEKVNPDTTGDRTEKKEFAMYVVNPTGSPNSRLVADIVLEHQ